MSAASPPPQQQPAFTQQPIDPMAQLRDIHQPNMIETWPPAPGWWLLATLVLTVLMTVIARAFHHWVANRYRREAIEELNTLLTEWRSHQDDQIYLASLQKLLKRVALTAFPRSEVASLTGEAWLQFLDLSANSRDFSVGEIELLIDGNYRPNLIVNVESMQAFALQWIKQHQSRFLQPRST